MYLLDTNVLSELRKLDGGRADPRVVAWADSVAASQFLSVITLMEIEMGALQIERKDPRQGAMLRAWIELKILPNFDDHILAVDNRIARRCAALHVPNPCSYRDSLIAATALVHGMTVVTRDASHFKRTGVSLLNPWEI
jgi:predicted nucleic acid-binding protein